VKLAGIKKQFEFGIAKRKECTPEREGKLSAPQSVAVVSRFIYTARVMEEGKQNDHILMRPGLFGHAQTVFHDPRPVINPVEPALWKSVAL
jgi:hypothetical protein